MKNLLLKVFCLLALGLSSFAALAGDVFVSSSPCVVFDTRSSTTGKMSGNEARTFHVVGDTSDFADQGGLSGCVPGFEDGVPSVTAVLINLVAIDPDGVGNLKAWATDVPETGGGVVNYQALTPNLNNSNAFVLEVRQDSEGNDIVVRANNSGVHVRGIIQGWFVPEAVSYVENFTNGAVASEQCNVWEDFLYHLGTAYRSVQIFGSRGAVNTCTDVAAVRQIAKGLRDGTATTVTCGSDTWRTGLCGGVPEISVNQSICFCNSTSPNAALRPCIFNSNWGGINGDTCAAASQRMELRFNP